MSVVSTTPSGTTSFAGRTWTVGDLAVGAGATLTVLLTARPSAAVATDAICGAAAVTASNETLINPADDAATVCTSLTRQVDLVVTQTESTDPVLGGSSGVHTYVVTVQNAGRSDATGVTLIELPTWPTGVMVQSVAPSQGSFLLATPSDGTWNAGDLPLDATANLTVAVAVDAATATGRNAICNTASAGAANETLVNAGNDTRTECTSVIAPAVPHSRTARSTRPSRRWWWSARRWRTNC